MPYAANLEKLVTIDPELNDLSEIAEGISAQAQELAIEMAGYAEEIEYDPKRLNEIEERLELISSLRRRYGVTIELVLEHAEKARQDLSNIEHSEERLEELRAKYGTLAEVAPLPPAARPVTPLSSVTSASRVGFPRESRISRAWILVIAVMASHPIC